MTEIRSPSARIALVRGRSVPPRNFAGPGWRQTGTRKMDSAAQRETLRIYVLRRESPSRDHQEFHALAPPKFGAYANRNVQHRSERNISRCKSQALHAARPAVPGLPAAGETLLGLHRQELRR